MFTFKPKKVFDKLNKMDRKQAYTIGAIAVVSIVALLMLVSAATSTNDDSFEGMAARGYDLANMPFATDAAEQYLLSAKYPDMKENGSTLLYSAAEKQARQEEDAQTAEENDAANEDYTGYDDNTSAARSDNGGYGGYRGGGTGGGRGGNGKTEVGQLGSAGMASAGGSGVNSTWGPTGDFRQFKGRENRGNEAPIQLKTADARQALAQFRQGSRAAASFKEGKMTGARKALLGGNVAGSEAITKDGVDLSKLQSGGLTLDTDAPPTTTDLDNLDKKVAEAAKKAEEKKKEEEKTPWWLQMLQNVAQSALQSLVDSVMGGIGDTIRGGINGSIAARKARNAEYRADSDLQYARLTNDDVRVMTNGKYNTVDDFKKAYSQKSYYSNFGKNNAKNNPAVAARANDAARDSAAEARAKAAEDHARREAERAEQRREEHEKEMAKIQQNTDKNKDKK